MIKSLALLVFATFLSLPSLVLSVIPDDNEMLRYEKKMARCSTRLHGLGIELEYPLLDVSDQGLRAGLEEISKELSGILAILDGGMTLPIYMRLLKLEEASRALFGSNRTVLGCSVAPGNNLLSPAFVEAIRLIMSDLHERGNRLGSPMPLEFFFSYFDGYLYFSPITFMSLFADYRFSFDMAKATSQLEDLTESSDFGSLPDGLLCFIATVHLRPKFFLELDPDCTPLDLEQQQAHRLCPIIVGLLRGILASDRIAVLLLLMGVDPFVILEHLGGMPCVGLVTLGKFPSCVRITPSPVLLFGLEQIKQSFPRYCWRKLDSETDIVRTILILDEFCFRYMVELEVGTDEFVRANCEFLNDVMVFIGLKLGKPHLSAAYDLFISFLKGLGGTIRRKLIGYVNRDYRSAVIYRARERSLFRKDLQKPPPGNQATS